MGASIDTLPPWHNALDARRARRRSKRTLTTCARCQGPLPVGDGQDGATVDGQRRDHVATARRRFGSFQSRFAATARRHLESLCPVAGRCKSSMACRPVDQFAPCVLRRAPRRSRCERSGAAEREALQKSGGPTSGIHPPRPLQLIFASAAQSEALQKGSPTCGGFSGKGAVGNLAVLVFPRAPAAGSAPPPREPAAAPHSAIQARCGLPGLARPRGASSFSHAAETLIVSFDPSTRFRLLRRRWGVQRSADSARLARRATGSPRP